MEHSKVCQTCGKRFKRTVSLQSHLETAHLDSVSKGMPNKYVCDRAGCSKSYNRLNNLQAHIRANHGEPRFTCPKCGNKYRHKKSLKLHINSTLCQTGDKNENRKANIEMSEAERQEQKGTTISNVEKLSSNIINSSLPSISTITNKGQQSTLHNNNNINISNQRQKIRNIKPLISKSNFDEIDQLAMKLADNVSQNQ